MKRQIISIVVVLAMLVGCIPGIESISMNATADSAVIDTEPASDAAAVDVQDADAENVDDTSTEDADADPENADETDGESEGDYALATTDGDIALAAQLSTSPLYSFFGTEGTFGWYVSEVKIGISQNLTLVTDSGWDVSLDGETYSPDYVTFSTEGENYLTLYFRNSDGDIAGPVTTTVKIDMTDPYFNGTTDGIQIEDDVFDTLIDSISMGRTYSGASLNVNIAATDDVSGIYRYYYYVDTDVDEDSSVLTEEQLADVKWSESTDGTVEIAETGNYVIYAYAVDKAGHATDYICTDAFTFNQIVVVDDINNVYTVGEGGDYATFQDVIETAAANDDTLYTVQMVSDVTESCVMFAESDYATYTKDGIQKDITLDLNGCTLTSTSDSGYAIKTNYGYFTLKDSTASDPVRVTNLSEVPSSIYSDGVFTPGCTSSTSGGKTTYTAYYSAGSDSSGNLVVWKYTSGAIVGNGCSDGICQCGNILDPGEDVLTIDGGIITEFGYGSFRGNAVETESYESTADVRIVMNGGVIINNKYTGIENGLGNMRMTGGAVVGNRADSFFNTEAGVYPGSNLYLSGQVVISQNISLAYYDGMSVGWYNCNVYTGWIIFEGALQEGSYVGLYKGNVTSGSAISQWETDTDYYKTSAQYIHSDKNGYWIDRDTGEVFLNEDDTQYYVAIKENSTGGQLVLIEGVEEEDGNALTISTNPTLEGVYGTTVGDMTPTGGMVVNSSGEEVSGSWALTDSRTSDVPNVGGSTSYLLTFTPDDTNYSEVYVYVTPTVTAKSISGATISDIETSYDYTGEAITPVPTVTLDGTTLTLDTDYTVSYENNTDAGSTATITITGTGNYKDTVTATFTINETSEPEPEEPEEPEEPDEPEEPEEPETKDIGDAEVTLDGETYTYTGSEITPSVTVVYDSTELVLGTDYTVSYSDNVDAGTATVTITGTGDYEGTNSASFTISPKDIASATVTGIDASYEYDGSAITPVPTVSMNGTDLVVGTDYTVSYENNTGEGTAKVTISGMGNYSGDIEIEFTIVAVGEPTYKIDGDLVNGWYTSAVTITPGDGWLISTDGSDWESSLTYTADGTYTLTLRFKNSDSGTVSDYTASETIQIDTTAPYFDQSTDGINIKSNWFRSFISKITFGLFFNDSTLTVNISGSDETSGVETYYYYIDTSGSSQALSAEELANVNWQVATNGSFTMGGSEGDYVVYAYVADAAGNLSSVINSNGIVIDWTAMTLTTGDAEMTETTATVPVTMGEAGTLYWVVSETELSGVTAESIMGNANVQSTTKTTAGSVNVSASDLEAGTEYYVYLVAVDQAGNVTSVVTTTFTTTSTEEPEPEEPDEPDEPEEPEEPDEPEPTPEPETPDYTVYGTMGSSGWYTSAVTITPSDGWEISNDATNYNPYLELTVDGTYNLTLSFRDSSGNVSDTTYTETIKIDQNGPSFDGSSCGIEVKTNWFRSFLHTITFGLLFNDATITVNITADDTASGVATYYYYVDNSGSTTALTETQLESVTWSVATNGSFTMGNEGNYVIYAYAVDAAGNESSYINSDGIVIDRTAVTLTVGSTTTGDTTATVPVTMDDAGTLYWIVSDTPISNVTADSIIGNSNVQSATARTSGTVTASATGLSENTGYYMYLVATDAAGNVSSVVTATFTTTGATEPDEPEPEEPEEPEPEEPEEPEPEEPEEPEAKYISDATVNLGQSSYTYTGSAIEPTVTVTYDGTTLTKGTDYTVSYSNNTKVGTATITITGIGNYSGTRTVTFTIVDNSEPDEPEPEEPGEEYDSVTIDVADELGLGDDVKSETLDDIMPNGWEVDEEKMADEGLTIPETLLPGGEYIVYAVYTDEDGGTVYVTMDIIWPAHIIEEATDDDYVIGKDHSATIECTGDLSLLIDVLMDGALVDESNYDLASGSTILTFHEDYMDTLSLGKHTVTLEYPAGPVYATILVEELSSSEDENNESGDDESGSGNSGNTGSGNTGSGTTGSDASGSTGNDTSSGTGDNTSSGTTGGTTGGNTDGTTGTTIGGTDDGSTVDEGSDAGDNTSGGTETTDETATKTTDETATETTDDTTSDASDTTVSGSDSSDGSGSGSSSGSTTASTKTGDNSFAGLWIEMACICGAVVLVYSRKRKAR